LKKPKASAAKTAEKAAMMQVACLKTEMPGGYV